MRMDRIRERSMAWLLVLAMVALSWLGGLPEAGVQAAAKPQLRQSSVNLLIGKTTTLKWKKKPAGASVVWRSGSKKIATVNKNGKVKGIKKGKAKITANVTIKGKRHKLNCNVTVVRKAKKLTITDKKGKTLKTLELKEGEKASFKVAISPKASNDVVTSWKSGNAKVAKVDKKGNLTAIASGSTTITATAFGKAKASVKVTVVADEAPTPSPTPSPTPLVDGSVLKGAYHELFSIGAAVTPSQLKSENMLNHIKEQYNSVTMENDMKPDYILGKSANLIDKAQAEFPVPASYTEAKVPKLNFTTVDAAMEIVSKNGLKMRGHTLVWHSQTPGWFFRENYASSGALVTKDVMNARMEYYIQQVLLHVQTKYPGIIYAWDVVNEIFTDQGGMRAAGTNMSSGQSLWVSVYGSDEFAVNAFEYASKYREEGVKLFYNDYNEYGNAKANAIVNFAKKVLAKGSYIDGIGMQSHLDCAYPKVSGVGSAIDKFAGIAPGFEVQLTEVDVTINHGGRTGYTLDNQTQYYKELMETVVAKKRAGANITNVTFWGLYDEVSWRSSNKPLLYNYSASTGFVKKGAYESVLNAPK